MQHAATNMIGTGMIGTSTIGAGTIGAGTGASPGRRLLRAPCLALLCLALLCVLTVVPAAAQDLQFQAPASATATNVPMLMRDLAVRALPVYQDTNRDRYLANLAALQLVAGNYTAADDTLQSLLARLLRAGNTAEPLYRYLVYDVYARARSIETGSRVAYAQAFTRAFQQVVPRLDDLTAYQATSWLQMPPAGFQQALQDAFTGARSHQAVDLPQAVELVQTYLAFDLHRSPGPVATLVREDHQRRYITDPTLLIRGTGGSHIAAVAVYPRSPSKPLPTLLQFTLDPQAPNHALECAAHGYVGIVAYARGKGGSSGRPTPYEHDGADARTVINWIAQQSWSDGRVGMYGSGYSGFAAWSAARQAPRALLAIATSSPTAPGIDMPMDGGIFLSSAYPWALDATAGSKGSRLDATRWPAIEQNWYRSGRPYRDLEQLSGVTNPLFRRWLGHPSYDHYWQRLAPSRQQFAHLGVAVLVTAGYYGRGQSGALYYFDQQARYDHDAEQWLLLGPYDDLAMARAAQPQLGGYRPDAAALIDLRELRYQWFDHILKGQRLPALLQDHVNYQLMGTNQWRHAASLTAMAATSRRFYLQPGQPGQSNDSAHPAPGRLTEHAPRPAGVTAQSVDFADRSDAAWSAPTQLLGTTLPVHNSVVFVSAALAQPLDFSGRFSGRLDLRLNRFDVDLSIALYEQLANGQYLRLFAPSYQLRASYAGDRSTRHLLKNGERQQLVFHSDRITSRRLQAGSRLVMVLSVVKRADEQINYGTGGGVSGESVADAPTPLRLRWYGTSYIDIPVSR